MQVDTSVTSVKNSFHFFDYIRRLPPSLWSLVWKICNSYQAQNKKKYFPAKIFCHTQSWLECLQVYDKSCQIILVKGNFSEIHSAWYFVFYFYETLWSDILMITFPNFACVSVFECVFVCVCVCVYHYAKKMKLSVMVHFFAVLVCMCVCLERNGVIIWGVDVSDLKRGSYRQFF